MAARLDTVYDCSGRPNGRPASRLPADVNNSAALLLRFRMQSDTAVTASGWAIDNIRLQAGGDACRAQQQGDSIFIDGFDGI